jgi:hypothetical protein
VASFQAAVLDWHDFYVAVASASAALLGLLFVGVSIGLGSVAAADRADLLLKARQAFSNLSLILILSLCLLIPAQDAPTLGFELTIVGVVGLFGVFERFGLSGWRRTRRWWVSLLRRLAWSVAGDGILLVIALSLWLRPGVSPSLLYWLLWVVFVFLLNAARVSWSLLVQFSHEERSDADASASDH